MHLSSNAQNRSPRQRYVWPDKALSLVRSTRIPKKDGLAVVKQLKELTSYSEKVCWRLAEKHGFRRPHPHREWSREEVEKIIDMCRNGRSVPEMAAHFGTTVRTIYLKIIRHGQKVRRHGSIYNVSLICAVLRVSPATVKHWGEEGRLALKSQSNGSRTVQFAEDDEFERFCRENYNYLIRDVGGRVAPRERILFLREFVLAAQLADDHTARGHKREREAYAAQQQTDAEEKDDRDGNGVDEEFNDPD